MITLVIPTTENRRKRLDNLISFIRKNTQGEYSVMFMENKLGGWVPAFRAMLKQLNPRQLVCVLGDDCEPEVAWFMKLEETFWAHFPDGDGILQPNDTTWGGKIASFPVATAGFLLKWAYSGYTHNFCDEELANTARARGKYFYYPLSVINHRHHSNTPGVEKDATYHLEDESANADKALYQQRMNDSGNFTHWEVLKYD